MHRRHCLLLLLAAAVPAQARAADLPAGLVERVLDGDTFQLKDGTEVRLAGVLAPKPWQLPANPGHLAAGLPQRATETLGRIVLGQSVTLAAGTRASDRNGRLLAQVQRADALWVQGELLTRGFARVCTTLDNYDRADAMLAVESAARAARRGLWTAPEFRVLQASEAAAFVGRFQVVEGTPHDLRHGREQIYLHFGSDRRDALTLSIAAIERRRFVAGGRDPEGLVGKRLRVRGWLKSFDGPLIEATHPEQIERL